MARVTIEDCLRHVENRFALVHLAAGRVRQLQNGSARRVHCKNKDVVTALREIAVGKVIPQAAPPETEEAINLKIDIPDVV